MCGFALIFKNCIIKCFRGVILRRDKTDDSILRNFEYINKITIGENVKISDYCFNTSRFAGDIEFCSDTEIKINSFRDVTFRNMKFHKNITVDVQSPFFVNVTKNLIIGDNVKFKKGIFDTVFCQSAIKNLYIGKTEIKKDYFRDLMITNLKINKDALVEDNSFENSSGFNTSHCFSNNQISSSKLNKLGVHCIFDENTRTVIICGKKDEKPTIVDGMVAKIIEEVASESRVNLKLENCVVEPNVFEECNFIDNLMIGENVEFKKFSFFKAQFGGNIEFHNNTTLGLCAFAKSSSKRVVRNKGDMMNVTISFSYDPVSLTNSFIKDLMTVTGATAENRINLRLENCVVEKPGTFEKYDFINNLEIGDGVVLEEHAFSGISVEQLKINGNANIKKDSFSGSKIKNLVVTDTRNKIESDSFTKATVQNAQFKLHCDLSYIQDSYDVPIPYKKMQDWGFYRQLNSIPEEDEYCFDEKTRTVIVGTSDMSRINNITRETVEDIINKTNAKPENKINLVLQNCVVDENVFSCCEFIDNLTIKSNTTVLRNSFEKALIKNLIISGNNVTFVEYGFFSAQINNLTVKSNITIDGRGFSCVKIDNLTVENNATVKEDGFEYARINNLTVKNDATIQNDGFCCTKITGSAKYSNGSNISRETLKSWGVKIN